VKTIYKWITKHKLDGDEAQWEMSTIVT